jgi:hypothetical protein
LTSAAGRAPSGPPCRPRWEQRARPPGRPDGAAVRDYLIARFVAPEAAVAAAEQVATPITVTKRGAVILAGK